MKIPVYVISLLRDKERRNKISQDLHCINVGYKFFDAVDAKDIRNAELISQTRLIGGDGHVMTNGEIACMLSHQLVYKDILSNDHEWALILEDDVTVDKRTCGVLDALSSGEYSKLNVNNIYLLGGQQGLHEYPVLSLSLFNYVKIGRVKFRRVTYNQHKIRRTCCYLISKDMCEKLLGLANSYGPYRADSWKLMKKHGMVHDFYLSEIIVHPKVNEFNSNLESERLCSSENKIPRTPAGLLFKKIRSWLRCMFFSFYR
ncbi:beta-1,4-galactosyltransferase [Erwinia sp. CPCC 100877]|nr:beta-1,4-galactosyltransferase [Erwinia sp. CPCC 100877]